MYRLSILERRKKNSYAFFPKEKYFSDDEPITISFLKKTSFIALYLFADPRRLLQMPPFHVDTHTHTYTHTFLGRNDDGLVCDSSRSAKIEGKIALSWTFCIDMWNWVGGKNIKGKRTILTAFHDIKSFFEPLERRRSRAKREQHSRYSWKFENVSVTRLFCTSLHTHIHTYTRSFANVATIDS